MKTSFAFALFIASVASVVWAQASPATIGNSPTQLCYERTVNNSRLKNVVVRNEKFVEQPVVKRAESRADGVNVKIRVKYDPEKYSISDVVFWPEDGNANDAVGVDLNPESNETEANVPAGEYWISLVAESDDAKFPFIFLIKEHIQLTDGMVLSFDTAEAVNRISFRPRALDGEVVDLSLSDMDGNIVEAGNIGTFFSGATDFFGPNNLYFKSILFDCAKIKDEAGNVIDGLSYNDFLVNTVSDRFYAHQNVIMISLEGEAIFTDMSTRLNKNVTVSPEVDYKFIENKIVPSINHDPKFANIHEASLIYGWENRFMGRSFIGSVELKSPSFYAGMTSSSDFGDFINIASVSSYDKFVEGDPNPVYGISTAPTDGSVFTCYNYSDNFLYANFTCIKGASETDFQAKFNDVYTRTVGQTTGVYGNSVPMTSFCPMMTYKNTPQGFAPNFSFSFIGMNGEVRRIDGEVAQLEVKYGGETVCNSLKESAGWCWSWFADGAHRGVYDINLKNDNVMLGNIRGVNTTDIHFDLANDDNPLPPLLQWMQYRNSEGTVTPMLDKAAGSKLLFSAGVFDFNVDEAWQMWFTCREEPVNVKVEYALHGDDTFKELPVDVIADKFFTPGFGHQYEVALDAISEQSYLGWFDLRVSLSDNSGNTMTQLFEPAFNIAELAGLETVGSDAAAVGLDGRNIIAPAGSLVYDMSGRLVDGRDLAPGVYIVAAPASMTKVVVR